MNWFGTEESDDMNESDPRSDIHYLGSSENLLRIEESELGKKNTRQDSRSQTDG